MTRHPTSLDAVISWNLLAVAIAPAHSQTQADSAPVLRTITRQYHNHSYYTKGLQVSELLADASGAKYKETQNTYGKARGEARNSACR